MILHPDRFLKLARWLNKSGFVDAGLIRFAEFQMNSEEKRRRVYYSWVVFRHLHFNLNKIAAIINKVKIPVTVVVGQYDKVVQPKNMERLLSRLDDYVFETPEAGHTGLIAESGNYFRNLKALV